VIDNKAPANFGPLTLSKKNDSAITLNFNSQATESNFRQYKIYYKQGTAGVKQSDILFGSSSDAALAAQDYSGHTTTTISGLLAATSYVFNIFAYDHYGNLASATVELSTGTKSFPQQATSLNQYKANGFTVIPSGKLTNQNEVILSATSTDADNDPLHLYFQLASSSGTLLTATTTPAGACASGSTYASCLSKVWDPAESIDIKSVPDGSYQWQVLVCDTDGCAKSWTQYSGSVNDFGVDTISPTQPGHFRYFRFRHFFLGD